MAAKQHGKTAGAAPAQDIEPERRHSPLRRHLNDVAFDETGRFSCTKLSLPIGQAAALYLLIKHADAIILHWDALLILLTMLVFPRLLIRIINSKFPVAK